MKYSRVKSFERNYAPVKWARFEMKVELPFFYEKIHSYFNVELFVENVENYVLKSIIFNKCKELVFISKIQNVYFASNAVDEPGVFEIWFL